MRMTKTISVLGIAALLGGSIATLVLADGRPIAPPRSCLEQYPRPGSAPTNPAVNNSLSHTQMCLDATLIRAADQGLIACLNFAAVASQRCKSKTHWMLRRRI